MTEQLDLHDDLMDDEPKYMYVCPPGSTMQDYLAFLERNYTNNQETIAALHAAIRDALDLMREDGVTHNVDGQPTAYAALLAGAVGVALEGGE